ncbi:Gfo/Idh/MocA family protein [Lignipirellula cremea]|uniref:1,5-anhydro-D-fructose reductase n=1 Tax=Lignipirellula cremea TaxID=2528010 RepID=A0A518E1J4_9BACT|nr:Gfo/Idh/MocA family oxidoreductase [Lignipirellula cremea]QDU97942.1 1,5-anhydro-D-fructose reductase [Lignipirellula cremea]
MPRIDRRHFLAATSAAAVGGYFSQTAAAEDSTSPNERLNIAAVGATGRAGADLRGVASQNIICIADVDQNLLEQGSKPYPDARRYEDFRVMLEKEGDKIDAVVIGTPDHTHAPAAAMAMRMKKHVYCEKPLTNTVREARVLAELARDNKLVTQMGNQIHAGDNYRRVVELIQSGVIGPVREAHVWVGVDYGGGRLGKTKPVPPNLNWDLWQGPATARPYCDITIKGEPKPLHPFNWRWFWDYGSGGLGDFGCHYMDLVHWALDLTAPTKVSASGPPVLPQAAGAGLTVEYEYPARGDLPPVKLTWNDGGKKPAIARTLKDADGKPLDWSGAQLFVGEKGMILSNYGKHLLLPVDRFADFTPPEPTIPNSIGHHAEWIQAIRTGGPTTCNFTYAGALTEAVLLGVAAYRSGQTLEWDAKNFQVTNAPEAQQYLHREYRKGWTL